MSYRSEYDSGLCCMARHANAVAPWTCDCPCHIDRLSYADEDDEDDSLSPPDWFLRDHDEAEQETIYVGGAVEEEYRDYGSATD